MNYMNGMTQNDRLIAELDECEKMLSGQNVTTFVVRNYWLERKAWIEFCLTLNANRSAKCSK